MQKIPISLSHKNPTIFWQFVTPVYDDTERYSIHQTYQNVQYFIWSKNNVFNFTAVIYSAQVQWNDTMLRMTIQRTRITCFLYSEVHVSKKNHPLSSSDSIWSIPYSRKLCNQNCVVKTSETLIVWSAFCYTAGSDKSDAIEGVPDQLLKRVAMVFRAHSRHVELLLTYWCSQLTMIVNFEGIVCNNWT